MAWTIGDYSAFVSEARELFGVDREEANYLYHELASDLERPVTADDLYDYGDLAADIIEPLLPPEGVEVPEEYEDRSDAYEYWVEEADDRTFEEWWEEEWVDEGDEVEITDELHYKER